VQIAGKINQTIRDDGLRELGQLEQDIVFGEAGTKELISYLRANQVLVCASGLTISTPYVLNNRCYPAHPRNTLFAVSIC